MVEVVADRQSTGHCTEVDMDNHASGDRVGLPRSTIDDEFVDIKDLDECSTFSGKGRSKLISMKCQQDGSVLVHRLRYACTSSCV